MNVHFENLSQGHTQSIWSVNGLLEIQENPIIALPYESMSNIQLKTQIVLVARIAFLLT